MINSIRLVLFTVVILTLSCQNNTKKNKEIPLKTTTKKDH
jgi:hypothetical protein